MFFCVIITIIITVEYKFHHNIINTQVVWNTMEYYILKIRFKEISPNKYAEVP